MSQAHLGFHGHRGQLHHFLHHRLKRGNFGGHPLGLWDKLFGTELPEYAEQLALSQPLAKFSKRAWPIGGSATLLCLTGWLLQHLPLWIIVSSLVIFWVLLVDGVLAIQPPGPRKLQKVFVIGLSRTGTTSLNAALNALGWRSYHFSRHLVRFESELAGASPVPKLNPAGAAAFDGFSDISVDLVFEELASAYPEARFVYSTRKAELWGPAMFQFVQQHRWLFQRHSVANRFFATLYGSSWASLSAEEYTQFYHAYDRRVRAFFATRANRLLELDVSSTNPWGRLFEFLGLSPDSVPCTPFPHRYVFGYSFLDQPRDQVYDLVYRMVVALQKIWGVGLPMLLLVWWLGTSGIEYGQCARVCRSQGGGGTLLSGFFYGDYCLCASNNNSLSPMVVPRYHVAENWTWPYTTLEVCGVDGRAYENTTQAAAAGVSVVNCGGCGKCSSTEAVDVYVTLGSRMTNVATKCALTNLFFGESAGKWCVEEYMGLPSDCASCWLDNMGCTTTHCFRECVLGEGNPLTTANNREGSKLNSCLLCDELHCSPTFLRCAGANRRTAGVVTDITRNANEICLPAAERLRDRKLS